MDIEGARDELLRKALAHIDTNYSKGMETAVPTKSRIYGVRIPMLRSVVREWKKQNPTASQEEVLQLVRSLRRGGSREENILALMLVSNHWGLTEKLSWNDFLSWGRTLDNWETIDSLGGTLGEWVLDKPDERLSRLYELVEQDNLWLRRLGVVATVYLNRRKKGTAFPSEPSR